ncbi:MAG: hypothetical protein IJZ68_06265 [Bacteroidaceae bacterium]|nr:hypothetical protein [Bacteroidaceae bacterium]
MFGFKKPTIDEWLKVGAKVWYDAGYAQEVTVLEVYRSGELFMAKIFRKAPAEEVLVECKDLYKTYRECSIAINAKSEALKEKYRESIRTVEDLVLFCLTHKVEYREYCPTEARIVALEKAKELLGITLKT